MQKNFVWVQCGIAACIENSAVYPFTRISRGAMPKSLFMTNAVERNNDLFPVCTLNSHALRYACGKRYGCSAA
jgi:hypothetical protein